LIDSDVHIIKELQRISSYLEMLIEMFAKAFPDSLPKDEEEKFKRAKQDKKIGFD
jgi:hypothetical protein